MQRRAALGLLGAALLGAATGACSDDSGIGGAGGVTATGGGNGAAGPSSSSGVDLTSSSSGPLPPVFNVSGVVVDLQDGCARVRAAHLDLELAVRCHQLDGLCPLLQDLYSGTAYALADQSDCESAGGLYRQGAVPGSPGDADNRCYIGSGVLPDLNDCGDPGMEACDDPDISAADAPTSFGTCADCHALAMDGPAGGRNLLDADGLAFDNGNHCDDLAVMVRASWAGIIPGRVTPRSRASRTSASSFDEDGAVHADGRMVLAIERILAGDIEQERRRRS